MYAQVDSEVYDTFLMNCMVDYRHNEHAVTIQDQNIVVKGRPSLQRSTVVWFISIHCDSVQDSYEEQEF